MSSNSSKKSSSLSEDQSYILSQNTDFYIREAYNSLRTNVMFSLPDESKSKVIVVTSSIQGDGKSITCINLALAFAESDKKVLLIDCDLRRPKLSRLLRINSKIGITNVLMDPPLLKNAIFDYEGKMHVLLAGNIPPNPSELLGSSRMRNLLEAVKEHYDVIIIDTPPVNMVTDAVVVAPYSNGVLFVVRENYDDRISLTHALESLEYAKAKVLGFVLNGASNENQRYGYGKYKYRYSSKYGYRYGRRYGYRYGYGDSSDKNQ